MPEAPAPSPPPTSDDAPAPAPAPKSDSSAFLRNTLARLATAVVGIPILLWLMFVGPGWAYQVVVLLAIARAGYELTGMTFPGEPLLRAWGVAATVVIAAVLALAPDGPLPATLMLVVTGAGALLALSRPEPNEAAGVRLAWLVAGPLYVGALASSVARLHTFPQGGQWVLLSMWIAWASDTGAYFAGRAFGRRKLAPSISPAKTVEGALGGLAGSLTGAFAAHYGFLPSLPLVDALVLAAFANVLGQAGDLVESLIKRATRVKDSGSILPGHGGMLDRIDALVFTATACVLYVVWVAPLRGGTP